MKKYFFIFTIILSMNSHAAEKDYLISQNPIQQKTLAKVIKQQTSWYHMPVYQYNTDTNKVIPIGHISDNPNNDVNLHRTIVNDIQNAIAADLVVFCTFSDGGNAVLYNTKNCDLCLLIEDIEKEREKFEKAFPGMG